MIPHQDDIRSPIYDLHEWLQQFPSATGPQSPHGDIITGSTEPQCPECGLNHPPDHPCPEMSGGSAEMPVPDDLEITAAWYDSQGDPAAHTFDPINPGGQQQGVYYDTENEDQGQPRLRDQYYQLVACPHCGHMNPDRGANLYQQACLSCGYDLEGGLPTPNPNYALSQPKTDDRPGQEAQENGWLHGYGTPEGATNDWDEDAEDPEWTPELEQQNRTKAWGDPQLGTHEIGTNIAPETIRPINAGMNPSHKGWTDQGDQVIFKPKNGETLSSVRHSITPGADAEREYAAYLMSHHLDLPGARVPTTRLGTVDFGVTQDQPEYPLSGRAMIQRYTPGDDYDEPQNIPLSQRRNAAIFDSLIGNHDRHGGNGMLTYGPNREVHFLPIDHGLSFPDKAIHQPYANNDLVQHFWNTEPDPMHPDYGYSGNVETGGYSPYLTWPERTAIQDRILNNPELWQQLQGVLPPQAVDFAKKRAQFMFDRGHMLNLNHMTAAHAGGDDPQSMAPFFGQSPMEYARDQGHSLPGVNECDKCGAEYDANLSPFDEDGGITKNRDHLCHYCYGQEYPEEWEKGHQEWIKEHPSQDYEEIAKQPNPLKVPSIKDWNEVKPCPWCDTQNEMIGHEYTKCRNCGKQYSIDDL
jgi:hypothetical protein